MKIVIQRVNQASVSVSNEIVAQIDYGLLILVGIEESDDETDSLWLASKVVNLRIFSDSEGLMNQSIQEANGDIILVSQFTLHALTKKGNRPSYIKAARPEKAIPLYENFISKIENQLGKKIKTGVFGADMQVALINNGPVTIIIDSKNKE